MMRMRTKLSQLACAIAFSAAACGSLSAATITRDNGSPVGDNQNSQTAGPSGPVLLQDSQLIEKLQRFDRERIPERVVHARGTGAFGSFVTSADFSDITRADLFRAGKTTPVFVRFSTVAGASGTPETLRDPRGFAVKFYTEQGNWDLVGINFPIFFIRDAIKFPDFIHSQKPDPVTNVQDPNRAFDFFAHAPESTAMLTWLYSNRGTPVSYRKMDGFGNHAFKLVNAKGEVHYVKFHWKSRQGIENLTPDQVPQMIAKDWNYLTNDLYGALGKGENPQWDLMVQVLKPEQIDRFDYDALDATKEWKDVPERMVGTLTLNKVPANFFESTEQSAFAPSHLVPGIEPSEDRMLQGRLFSYADTQIYRLGANGINLPINRPRVPVTNNNEGGGRQCAQPRGQHRLRSHDARRPEAGPGLSPDRNAARRHHATARDQEEAGVPAGRRALPVAVGGGSVGPRRQPRGRPQAGPQPGQPVRRVVVSLQGRSGNGSAGGKRRERRRGACQATGRQARRLR